MKEPRVNDFDPKATPLLKSPLDDMPMIGKPPQKAADRSSGGLANERLGNGMTLPVGAMPERTPAVPSEVPPVRTPVRVKRTITRYAFEFFQDQLERLKKFSLEEQMNGEKGSMSQMVREAIDSYISKRMRTEE